MSQVEMLQAYLFLCEKYQNSLNLARQLSLDMLVEYSLHGRMISVTGAHEFYYPYS